MTPNSVKTLNLIINIGKECIEESNRIKYMALAPSDESKVKLKQCEKNRKNVKSNEIKE